MFGFETSGALGPPLSPCCGPQGAGASGRSVRSGMEKRYRAKRGKATGHKLASLNCQCQAWPMIRFGRALTTFTVALFCGSNLSAQNASPAAGSEEVSLLGLTKKIEEQNTKIDALSQQILRLQQEVMALKPAPAAIPVGENASPSPGPVGNGPTHVVARGETLTSIARQHKVTIDELQKLNHITDDRRLQIGQTLALPTPVNATSSPSPTPTPNE